MWHAVVFDRSASVERTRPDFAAWMRATLEIEAAHAREQDRELVALVFAGDRLWWLAPGDGGREVGPPPSVGATLSSDLSGALELLRTAALTAHARGGIVRCFTDWRATTPAVQGSAKALAQAGLRLEAGELGPASLDDLALVELRAPEQLESGAPLACELRVEAVLSSFPGKRRVSVQFELSSAGSRRSMRFDRLLDPSQTSVTWRFDLGAAPAGGMQIAARVELVGDPVPENDSGSLWVDVGGALPIAVVASDQSSSAARAFTTDGERWPGLVFLPTTPAELPAALAHVRAALTLDIEPGALPIELLQAFVEAGGGWLSCAGLAALRGADALPGSDNAARELLPLWPENPARAERDVLLLVDGSGSMAGDKFDAVKNAALRLAGVAPAQDRVWLGFFGSKLEPLFLLREANAKPAAPSDLVALFLARAPGGATDIKGSLAQLSRERAGLPREMLALLLSDGRDPTAASRLELAPLRAQLAQSRIALRAFAFGADAEREFLAGLLPEGQSLTAVDEPALLADLVARSVDDERVRRHTRSVPRLAEDFPAGSSAAELASALGLNAPKSLERVWLARAHPQAELLWRTAEGDPLLAVRTLGLGCCAAFASLPSEGWAESVNAPAVFGPLLRTLAREGSPGPQLARATCEAGALWVRGLKPDLPARIVALLPGGPPLELTPPAALADQPLTTRWAALDSELAAGLSSGALQLRTLDGRALGSFSLEVPRSPEFMAPGVLLTRDLAGAELSQPGRSGHPAAPWVLLGALGLLALGLILGLESRAAG